MQATKLDPEYLHRLNKFYPKILDHITEQRPEIYKDGDTYCCFSGPTAAEGIFGHGESEEDALEDWEKNYQKSQTDGKN